jgi:hypothetical protein
MQNYNYGELPYITLYEIKSLCERNNIQLNIIFKPGSIQLKFIRLNPITNKQEKSEIRTYSNKEISTHCTRAAINLIINNLMTDVFKVL